MLQLESNVPAAQFAQLLTPRTHFDEASFLLRHGADNGTYLWDTTLAFDVAGFSLAYAGLFLIALMFYKTHRWLARLTVGSLVLFVANVPCLWFSPMLAVVLRVLSIFLFALVPLLLVRMTTKEWSAPAPARM